MYVCMHMITWMQVSIINFFIFFPLIQKARKRLNQILSEIIRERKEKRLVEKDLLDHLLNFKDEKGKTLTEDQIVDNIIGVLFAAQDTTASFMTWILKFLHDDPKLIEAVKVNHSSMTLKDNLTIYHPRIEFFFFSLNGSQKSLQAEQKAIYESNNGRKEHLTWAETRKMTLTYRV